MLCQSPRPRSFLFIYKYGWPDVAPYARILKGLAERLVEEGHSATVFCGQPSYNGSINVRRPWREFECGVEYVRMPLLKQRARTGIFRIVNDLIFLIGSFLYGLWTRKKDVMMTVTSPPAIMGAVVRWVARLRGAVLIYHCQDLHPEAGIVAGILKEGVVTRAMAAVELANVRDADLIITLSEEMAESIRVRGVNGSNIEILNNFSDTPGHGAVILPEALQRRPGTFRVLFAGNHGAFQGLDQVIAAAWRLKRISTIQFQFLGEGVFKPRLMEMAGALLGTTVFFHPHVTEEQAFRVMQESDLGIVSLRPEMYRYAYPSKAGSLLFSGCPLLVIMDDESSLARLVYEERLGYVCPPGDITAIATTILDASRGRIACSSRERIRTVAETCMGREAILSRWSRLVMERCESSDAPVLH